MDATMARPAGPVRLPLGLLGFLATTVMLFTAFAASYLIRRTAADWQPVALPAAAWVNLAVLGAASAALVRAGRGDGEARTRWIGVALLLGAAFLGGQALVWAQLAGRGVFLRSSPHAAFLYLMSGLHGLHLLGGMVALAVATARPRLLEHCSAYWHVMGVIWLLLVVLVSVM